jgi:hypothetical protein
MGESKEVEGLRFFLAPFLPIPGRKSSELDQARLFGVQFQAELT